MSDEKNLNAQVDAVKAGLESKFQGLTDKLEAMKADGASKTELTKLTDAIKTQGEKLQDFEDAKNEATGKTFDQQLRGFMTTNKEKIADTFKAGHGHLEFTPDHDEIDKAVGDIMRANGLIGTVPAWNDVQLPDVMLRNDNPMLGFANNYRTRSASQPYSEITGHEGDALAVGEGLIKPQIDFDWVTNYATPYKVAAYEVLSEEVVDDIPRMMSVAKGFLKQKHDLKKVNYVYFGDGVTVNPKGATVYASAFTPDAGLTGKLPLNSANIMDVINAAILSVWNAPSIVDGIQVEPNLVMMNPTDFTLEFVMAKNADGLPLYPQAMMFNRVTIGGVTIVPWVTIPAGKIFVSDMKKYNIGNYIPYFIKIGWINDQLIKNLFTIVGESRFFAYVKSQDENAFMYDDVGTIRDSIEADS